MISTQPYAEAMEELRALLDEAARREASEPLAAALATAGRAGRPSVRTVSIAAVEEAGLLFFVDVRSGKGRQLAENPRAALCFFWPQLHQQIIVEGEAEVLEETVSDRYWAKRPRDFQLAAWVYDAPRTMEAKTEPRDRLRAGRRRFASRFVPRPPHWRAVRVRPAAIRFWKPGWRRLHARVCYVRDEHGCWRKERIEPFLTP